ncbi:MAG: choice-of-anchor Q domain-containing protein [Wenzhouxiangella sp.]
MTYRSLLIAFLASTFLWTVSTVAASAPHLTRQAESPRASTLNVPADFPTIQLAIAAANDGDTVLVAAGIYAERLDFLGKAISLVSVDGAEATLIDGSGPANGYVVRIEAGQPGASLQGFTITGGFGSNMTGPGGGLLIRNTEVSLNNLVVTANQATIGGGLLVDNAAVAVNEVEFSDNVALFGGAIRVEGGSLTVTNSRFEANQAQTDGGAMSVFWANEIAIADTVFVGNRAHGIGAALALSNTVLNASDLRFTGNGEATPAGHPPGSAVSYSPLVGGALYTANVSGQLDRARFQGNAAFRGAAYYAAGNSGLVINNALIQGNQAGTGVVFVNGSSPSLVNTTLVDNDGFGIFTTFGAQPLLANSIVSGHGSIASQEIAGNGLVQVEYSLINGHFNGVNLGSGIILDEPPALDADADFAPLPGSPVIDAGNNALLAEAITLDLLGNARFVDDPDAPNTGVGDGPLVDLGAVERQIDETTRPDPVPWQSMMPSSRPAPRPMPVPSRPVKNP